MPTYRIYGAPVRNETTGEVDPAMVGEEVTVVTRDTTTPFPIQDGAADPIADSVLIVQTAHVLPVCYFVSDTPTTVYLDWYHAGSGARGPIFFEEVLREVAATAVTAADASNTAAQGALAAAQALDSTRMQLAGAAVAQGAAFWGVWTAGAAPTPPNDGKVHWGLEIVP